MSGSERPVSPPAPRPVACTVNGAAYEAPPRASALDVVTAFGLADRPIAVEVNERVVPRPQLAGCMIQDGDRLEIVTLVGGG